MELPLTPLAFADRARRIYSSRKAILFDAVDRTYAEFLDRCDRWSSRLQRFGVKRGDRIAYIAQNIPAHLEGYEGYYAVPRIGAVLVPINYRLASADFVYIINHSGARLLCVDEDSIDVIEAIRDQLPGVERFVALEGAREGWLDYEAEIAAATAAFEPVDDRRERSDHDQLHQRHDGQPKGVMITHRNAYLNVVGTLAHFAMTPADRYLWTLPMFHANGWTFVWLSPRVARRTCACARSIRPRSSASSARPGSRRCARRPTVLIGIANAPAEARALAAGRRVRLLTAGAPPAAVTIDAHRKRTRLGGAARLWNDGNLAVDPALRAAAGARRSCPRRARRPSRRARASNLSAPARSA